MIITLTKFGHLLSSRELGREAWRAYRATVEQRDPHQPVIVDFAGITTFSPSWGDEFFTALLNVVDGKLIFRHTTNPSVKATLDLLKDIHGDRFVIES